jgi:hypothetical protein
MTILPYLLYDNILAKGVLTATSEADGYDVNNIIDGRTYTFHQFAVAGTAYITANCGSAQAADHLAIISHNLNTAGATVSLESSDDGNSWTQRIAGFTPSDDKAFIKAFDTPGVISAQYWRIKIITATIPAQIGVAVLGVVMEFPYPPETPFTPETAIVTDSSDSKGGNLLGSVIRYKPITLNVSFTYLTKTWIDTYYDLFWNDHGSELKPFFFSYGDDLYWVKLDPASVKSYPRTKSTMVDSLNLKMIGVLEV